MFYYCPQRSCEGYVLQVSVCPQRGGIPACLAAGLRGEGVCVCVCVLSQHALQVVSQHALQQVSRRVPGPGGGVCLGGCLVQGICSHRGLLQGGALRQTPQGKRLLLRMIRIPLECILVVMIKVSIWHAKTFVKHCFLSFAITKYWIKPHNLQDYLLLLVFSVVSPHLLDQLLRNQSQQKDRLVFILFSY